MKTRYGLRTYTMHFVFALAAMWPLQAVVANEDVTTLCNNGSTALYFASLAEQTGFNQTRAMIQGMTEVKPGACEDIMPYGMHKVMLAFFKKDSRGILTNTNIVPKNATQVNRGVQHICVNMSTPYRLFGNRQSMYSRYVNTACPQGFSPAKPAWVHQPGGLTEYHVTVHANAPAKPWHDQAGKTYTSAPVLRAGALYGAGLLVQASPDAERDNQQAEVLLEAGQKYVERKRKEAVQVRARRQAHQQRQQQRYNKQVKTAEQNLVKPADSICAAYTKKTVFKRPTDIAISGVKLGMDLTSAHQALLCNDFSIDPRLLANAGGVTLFWANTREKKFHKVLENGVQVYTDVETRPPRGAPKGAAFVVLSVRVRYQHAQPLREADWEQVRAQFKRTYPAARRRAANPSVVQGRFKIGGVSHTLELVAEDYRLGRLSRYSITII